MTNTEKPEKVVDADEFNYQRWLRHMLYGKPGDVFIPHQEQKPAPGDNG
jgi:hypothetical protein